MPSEQSGGEIDRGVSEIVCLECETSPRLKSLNKNAGTQTMCDCDDVRKSMDAVPYEMRVGDLPDDWVVVKGRTPSDLAREVDALMAAEDHDCPECGSESGLQGSASCADCGHIPERYRA